MRRKCKLQYPKIYAYSIRNASAFELTPTLAPKKSSSSFKRYKNEFTAKAQSTQSVDSTDRAQEAIRAMNPLCTLRYSATHKNPYNIVYRLDPVKAFDLRLVKQIVVASATAEGGVNDAFVRVEQIEYKKDIKAKLRIHVQTAEGPKEKSVTVKNGADLFSVSNERARKTGTTSVMARATLTCAPIH